MKIVQEKLTLNNLVIVISMSKIKKKYIFTRHQTSSSAKHPTNHETKLKSHFINGIIAELALLSPSLPSSREAKPRGCRFNSPSRRWITLAQVLSPDSYTAFRDGRDEIHRREKKVGRNASSLVTDDELCFQREAKAASGRQCVAINAI